MKAIIIAAGMGKRLGPNTREVPKCLVPLGERTILDYQLEAFRRHGVTDVAIIRGYLGEMIGVPGARTYDNVEYLTNNILLSLMHARPEMDGPFLSTYCDIVFHPEAVRRLLESEADIAIVVDREWRKRYEGRVEHPAEEAELTRIDTAGRVREVHKAVTPEGSVGEFIGLAKWSARGAAILVEVWDDLVARYRGRDGEPFRRARSFRQAFLTDMLEEIIERGHEVRPVYIDGMWREIDTIQDLEVARQMMDWM